MQPRPKVIPLLLVALLGAGCSPSQVPAKHDKQPVPVLLPCDGSLALSIEVHYLPYGGFLSFELNNDGRFVFSSLGNDGAEAVCSGSLPKNSAFRSRLESLELHTLPLKSSAPVRDGTAIVVKGSCGPNSIDAIAKNIFAPNLRALTDTINEMLLAPNCEPRQRLPDDDELRNWSDTTGATELCADDCKSCNTCEP